MSESAINPSVADASGSSDGVVTGDMGAGGQVDQIETGTGPTPGGVVESQPIGGVDGNAEAGSDADGEAASGEAEGGEPGRGKAARDAGEHPGKGRGRGVQAQRDGEHPGKGGGKGKG